MSDLVCTVVVAASDNGGTLLRVDIGEMEFRLGLAPDTAEEFYAVNGIEPRVYPLQRWVGHLRKTASPHNGEGPWGFENPEGG